MSEKELTNHLKQECTKIKVECNICEQLLPKDQLFDPLVHNCTNTLDDKLSFTKGELQTNKMLMEEVA